MPQGNQGPTIYGGRWLIPQITHGGIQFVDPNTEQRANIAKYQQLAQQVEELDRQLAKLDQAIAVDDKRNKDTSWLDKSITGLTGDPQFAEQKRNFGQYAMMTAHMQPRQRGKIFENASSIRQAIYALVRAQTQLRAYQGIKDIDKHIPSEMDTNEWLKQKRSFWADKQAAAKEELSQMGIMVKSATVSPPSDLEQPESGEPATAPSGAPSGAPSPAGAGASMATPPPFKVKGSIDTSGGFTRGEDTEGHGWYVDPSTRKWVKVGE